MSNQFIYLKTDMTVEVVEIPHKDKLSKFYELLGCECIEVVPLPEFGDLLLVIDESGKCYDEPKPINPLASLLYPGTPEGNFIVGDVLVGKYGWMGNGYDVVGLYDPAIQHFTKFFENIKEIYKNG